MFRQVISIRWADCNLRRRRRATGCLEGLRVIPGFVIMRADDAHLRGELRPRRRDGLRRFPCAAPRRATPVHQAYVRTTPYHSSDRVAGAALSGSRDPDEFSHHCPCQPRWLIAASPTKGLLHTGEPCGVPASVSDTRPHPRKPPPATMIAAALTICRLTTRRSTCLMRALRGRFREARFDAYVAHLSRVTGYRPISALVPTGRGRGGPLQFPRQPSDRSTSPTPESPSAPAPRSQMPSMAFAPTGMGSAPSDSDGHFDGAAGFA